MSTSLSLENTIEDPSIVQSVNNLLFEAIQKNASDIHLEPYENYYRIRFRIDGILKNIKQVNTSIGLRITVRLKVLAALDISEHRLPQDGRFKLENATKESIHFRMNSCPTLHGEKIVLRLNQTQHSKLSLNQLGLTHEQARLFQNNLKQTQGMILVTGPTGSGKSTTLYAALNELNTSEKNISTVEDPIEYSIDGINQINVQTKINLNFPNSLRTLLRQDPDLLMIGEIRDFETADIAIKAAQTGHLVLSTLHTRSAIDSLARLINLGIATFDLSTTLSLIVAQRLLRKLCPFCKKSIILKSEHNCVRHDLFETIKNTQKIVTIYEAQGCTRCHSGYLGRIAIYELLQISPTLCYLIAQAEHHSKIEKAARTEGFTSLKIAAVTQLIAGATSLSEINRILPPTELKCYF